MEMNQSEEVCQNLTNDTHADIQVKFSYSYLILQSGSSINDVTLSYTILLESQTRFNEFTFTTDESICRYILIPIDTFY